MRLLLDRLGFALALAALLAVPAGCHRASSAERGPEGSRKTTLQSKYSKSGYDITPLGPEQVKALAAKLDPEAYRVTQKAATERPFCGTLLDNHKEGIYTCVVCGLPLFSSRNKFNSGTGWPSFDREFDPAHVAKHSYTVLGMTRTEINCARCGAHLGHVFDDGPKPTGERHCLNSASLKFVENGQPLPPESQPVKNETAYFAGGCFWGVQHYFTRGPGVVEAVSGYAQGHVDHVSYKQVCGGETGHAETVKVVFDPRRITYRRLLEAFFTMHDPTQLNRQGPDWGEQYRSGIWTTGDEQKREAEAFIREQEASKRYGTQKIVTQVEPLRKFWPAEEYHQEYLAKNGAVCHVKDPW
jgi:peptide methionine sulfoxide reductase msrA/msrB